MKIVSTVTLALFATMVFAGAAQAQNLKIKHGEIPVPMLPWVEAHSGTYDGYFQEALISRRNGKAKELGEKVSGRLELSIDGKKLALRSDVDPAGQSCGSTIGNLKRVEFDEDDRVTLSFDIKIGRCKPFGIYTYRLKLTTSAADPRFRAELVLFQGKYTTRKVVGYFAR